MADDSIGFETAPSSTGRNPPKAVKIPNRRRQAINMNIDFLRLMCTIWLMWFLGFSTI
jgi:hypothetical protein